MSRANRSFSSTNQPTPTVPGFTGGSAATEPWGVVRMIDGHEPGCLGTEGSNVHDPSAGDPGWHSEWSEYEYGDGD